MAFAGTGIHDADNQPLADFALAGPVYTIQDEAAGQRVIGTMDEISALSQLHDHAVYLHGADTYFVDRLDLDQKIAFVQHRDLDYYTQAVTASQIRIDAKERAEAFRGGLLGYGDVTVTTSIPMFKKIRFPSRFIWLHIRMISTSVKQCQLFR